MKNAITFLLIILTNMSSKGQGNYINVCMNCNNLTQIFDFNTSLDSSSYFLQIDTSQTNNLWQIGIPNKSNFNSGYIYPKALVTDTVNTYAENSLSSFQFSIINCPTVPCGWTNYVGLSIDVFHKINSDSLIDGGTIEVSHNNGVTWTNLIQDSINFPIIVHGNIYTLNDTIASLGKPGFSGSIGWNDFMIEYSPSYSTGLYDTISFKFTFSSDSIQTFKDGWMIGLIYFNGEFENIPSIQNDNYVSIFPNPTSDKLRIKAANYKGKQKVQILNYTGQLIYENFNLAEDFIETKSFANGIYVLKYFDQENMSQKKIVVHH